MTVDPLKTAEARMTIPIAAPQLWSVDQPTLYRVETRLLRDGKPIDARATRIGFREIRFDAGTGFYLNGVATKIKGVCVHQDHAGVGVAMPDAMWEWRIRRLKAMGCNALRCSHHAPAPELLDACDRLGMLVMDENRNFNPSPTICASWSGWSAATAIIHPSSSGRCSTRNRCRAPSRAMKWSAAWPRR